MYLEIEIFFVVLGTVAAGVSLFWLVGCCIHQKCTRQREAALRDEEQGRQQQQFQARANAQDRSHKQELAGKDRYLKELVDLITLLESQIKNRESEISKLSKEVAGSGVDSARRDRELAELRRELEDYKDEFNRTRQPLMRAVSVASAAVGPSLFAHQDSSSSSGDEDVNERTPLKFKLPSRGTING